MVESDTRLNYLLRNKDFLFFIIGRFCNVVGVQILTVAVGWHVYQLTGDPLDLGYIGLAQFLPALFLFLIAGYVSDKYDRRIILFFCNVAHFVVVVMLMLALWGEHSDVRIIFGILVLHGAARAFFHTAGQAILPNIVPTEAFPKAVAYSSSVNKAAQLIGPALGGGLIAWAEDWTYYVTLSMFALSAISSIIISARLKLEAPDKMTFSTLLGGFNFIWKNKIVLGAISIDLMAVLLGGVMGLLPIYASDILKVGADGLGIMRAMPGVGSLIMGLWLTQIASPRLIGPSLFISLFIFGLSIIVFSLSEVFWLSLIALTIYGASDMVSVYIRLTLVQLATPDQMRGRVSAVNSVSINASNELGDFRAGLCAAGLGTIPAVLLGGIATLGITATWFRCFPTIRGIDGFEDVEKRLK